MAKKRTEQKPRIVDYSFLEALAILAANASGDAAFSANYFKDQGLASGLNTLVNLKMVDKKSGVHRPYSLNDRGREYAGLVLDYAARISNEGAYQVNYSRAGPTAVLKIDCHQLKPSAIKIRSR